MTVAVLAIDVGGTKTASAIVAEDGSVLWSDTCATNVDGDSSGGERLTDVVTTALNDSGMTVAAIGLAIAAVLSPEDDSVVWSPNIPSWDGLDIRSTLRSILPVPITIEYDGHAAAIGEGWVGAGVGTRDFVVVAVGTGIGCGIVANGEVVRGVSRLAGAAGWMVLDPDGSSWEALSTSGGIGRLLDVALADHPDSLLATMEEPDAVAIFDAAAAGDDAASETVNRLARILGVGVANLVSILNPRRIILTGGIGSRGPELLPGITAAIADYAQPVAGGDIEVLTSPLGGSSVLLGAAKAALCAMEDDQMVDEKGTEL
ncbi:MAG: ROK family protein [Acidimicrobiia bacterium]|nr:ROK family protein [Acidimicrobiia bacterium]